jgi:hypothetical protein
MSQCFDLVPKVIMGKHTWDYGAVLLLFSAPLLFLQWMGKKKKTSKSGIGNVYMTLLSIFIIWLIFCLLYSLLFYQYPVLNTLKMARQMVIGYFSFFIFTYLFYLDEKAFETFIKWLYVITFLLLLVVLVQAVLGRPLLFGLHRNYGSVSRYLPGFLPISLFYLWNIQSRFFAGERVKLHELAYSGLVLITTILTYTRGYYFTVPCIFSIMIFLLLLKKRLRFSKLVIISLLSFICLSIAIASGAGDRMIQRASSGVEILLYGRSSSKLDENTFTGRLMLLNERIQIVSRHNPIVGYGFIHESDIPFEFRRKLKYGSVIYLPEMIKKYEQGSPYVLALFSADIGWANIVLSTGLAGFILFILFLVTFFFSYRGNTISDPRYYHFYLAFYLQMVTLVLLMFNGSPFTMTPHIPAFMLAGYLHCSMHKTNDHADSPIIKKEDCFHNENYNYHSVL